jgi:sialic acid synthase
MKKTNIVAELCCNHQGDFDLAKEMILTAKQCGADFVKMQKRDLASIPPNVYDRAYGGPHSFGSTYGDHREVLEFEPEEWLALSKYAKQCEIGFFATPFDVPSAQFLIEDIGCKYLKMGSTQIHSQEMIEFFAGLDKAGPQHVIMSTGMCGRKEIMELINKVRPDVIMQTTSCYPCNEDDVHLSVLNWLIGFGEVGLSGHYVSGNGAIESAAVAMGATWIERHFTLDRSWKGTDQAASLEPEGLKNVVKAVRTVERAWGECDKKLLNCELPVLNKVIRG